MDVKPLTRYVDPGYPTHSVLDAQPDLLRLTPKRWQGTAALLTGLAAACLMTSGCLPNYFVTTTCLSVAPPSYLSEEEARQVIIDEAKRARLHFRTDIPLTRNVELRYRAQSGGEMVERLAVTLDGIDTKRGIAYLYLGDDTLSKLRGNSYRISSLTTTPSGIDQVVIELQRAIIASSPQGTYGVFHAPDTDAEESDREELRTQVRDYVDWLKGQGVL